jgi:transposase
LTKIPGVGPITASAVVATIGDAANFTSDRHLSAEVIWSWVADFIRASGHAHRKERPDT